MRESESPTGSEGSDASSGSKRVSFGEKNIVAEFDPKQPGLRKRRKEKLPKDDAQTGESEEAPEPSRSGKGKRGKRSGGKRTGAVPTGDGSATEGVKERPSTEEKKSQAGQPPEARSESKEVPSNEDKSRRSSNEDTPSTWQLLVPAVLILIMSIGFALTPVDPDFYHELPESVKLALRERRRAQQAAGEDPAFMRKSAAPVFERSEWADAARPRPTVRFTYPACAPGQYPCVATEERLRFVIDGFAFGADGERLLVVDGSKHYMDRGDAPAPHERELGVSLTGLKGVGPHEATLMLLDSSGRVIAEDTVTFNLDPTAAEPAPPAAAAEPRQPETRPPPHPPRPPTPPAPATTSTPPAAAPSPPDPRAVARRAALEQCRASPPMSAGGATARILGPADGDVVGRVRVQFETTGVDVPDNGLVVLRVNGQDHPIRVPRGTLALDGITAGAHCVQILAADGGRSVVAASDAVVVHLASDEEIAAANNIAASGSRSSGAAATAQAPSSDAQAARAPAADDRATPPPTRATPAQTSAVGRGPDGTPRPRSRAEVARLSSRDLRALASAGEEDVSEAVLDWVDEELDARAGFGAHAPGHPALGGDHSGEESAIADGVALGESPVVDPARVADERPEELWVLPSGETLSDTALRGLSVRDLQELMDDPAIEDDLLDALENELDVRLLEAAGAW